MHSLTGCLSLRFFIPVPEIEQGLSDVAGSKVTVSFTPHLMPMVMICSLCCSFYPSFLLENVIFACLQSRGMQSTIYVEMASGVTVDDLYDQLKLFCEVLLN